MLVVAEEESFPAAALVAAHHVDADLLTAAVAFGALVHICRVKDTQANEKRRNLRHVTDAVAEDGAKRSIFQWIFLLAMV